MIAKPGHPFRGARRQPFTIITPDHAHTAPRHQTIDLQLQSAERNARCHQKMAPAERQFLARIEQGQLDAVVKLGFQCSCIDAFDLVARHTLSSRFNQAALMFERCT
jgi:hypothetical protein